MSHHLENLDDARVTYDHIYLSPHLDDAALSCGGAIARHVAANQYVLVVTICTAVPPADTTFSPFAQSLHEKWRLSAEQAVQMRLQEDLAAMDCLSADSCWLAMLDAIYRMPERYTSDETLFGTVAPNDLLLAQLTPTLQAIAQRYPNAIIYAPLGVGNHVDHQLVYTAAVALAREGSAVAFYEDFPYVTLAAALDRRLDELGGSVMFVPSVLNIDATLVRKISAIEAYSSQLTMLFGGAQPMAQAVTTYAEQLRPEVGTYGERLWLMK